MAVKTARLSKESRVVVPAVIRKQLDISPGDEVAFVIEHDVVRIVSPRALQTAVWTNNHGGDAGDSAIDIREQRLRDQDCDEDSLDEMELADQLDPRSEDEIVADLLAQL